MEAEEFLMKEFDLKKEGLIIPAKNYFKVDMTLAGLENLLIRYAKIKVSEISSNAVLAVSVLPDEDDEIEKIFNMNEAELDEKLKQLGYKDPDAMAQRIMDKVKETLSGKTDR